MLSNERKEQIKSNLIKIHQNFEKYQLPDQRQPQLICVSKNHPLNDILIANQLGEKIFAENRVQEMLKKQEMFMHLPEAEREKYDFKWHFIGTLQKNKIKDIVGLVDLIHSVHSFDLLERINKVSKKRGLISKVLIQVNIAEEESKHGFKVEELESVLEKSCEMKNVKIMGLMTMAPFYEDAEVYKSQIIFSKARELLNQYQKEYSADFNQLSMGMSHDYIYALKEGATFIRIGTDIFGERNYLM